MTENVQFLSLKLWCSLNEVKCLVLKIIRGVPIVAQWLMNPTGNHGVAGSIPGLAQWLRIRHCLELWYRSQDTARILCCCGCGVGRQLQLQLDH